MLSVADGGRKFLVEDPDRLGSHACLARTKPKLPIPGDNLPRRTAGLIDLGPRVRPALERLRRVGQRDKAARVLDNQV